MFYWRHRWELSAHPWSVEWAFTDRWGGHSQGAYGEFNLGAGVQDEPAAVASNRSALAAEFGIEPESLRFMKQVHSATVVTVDDQQGTEPPECDAMVSTSTTGALAVLVADCTPVLLADLDAGAVGVAHVGRQGMVSGVAPATVQAMVQRSGGSASGIRALIGPSICPGCYEVPEHMRAQAETAAPGCSAQSWTGTAAIDVAAGVQEQLRRAGVQSVDRIHGCSREAPDLYSYRRDGLTGRYAGVVRLVAHESGGA